MNRIYRTLWSVATQSWQAVPETAKTAGKKNVKSAASGVVATVALSFSLTGGANAQAPPAINQLPTGGTVVRGTATIQQTATAQAAAMVVNQTSQRAVVNWNTFNLGSAASVNFVQPNAEAVTLNRVNDSNPSQIFGRITSNGQVFITNANGVYFSPTSSVDVGAITATTHSISDDNFMSGNYVFERKGAVGKVVNEGRISAALGGYVALLAPEVQNTGVVVARAGTVAMAAGEMITLKLEGTGSLAGITATPSAIASLIENKQAVQAPDGLIILSAMALNKLQAGVIKNSGSLEANSLVSKGGKIYLEGDDITLASTSKLEAKGATGGGTVLVGGDWQGSGDLRQATKVTMEAGATIDASATDKGDGGKVVVWSDVHNADSVTAVHGSIKAEAGPNGGDGGKVETSGHLLNVDDSLVSTHASQGNSGQWLLDPFNVTISSANTTTDTLSGGVYTPSANTSVIKYTDLQTALTNGNVEVSTTGGPGAPAQAGNIAINSAISWSSSSTLKLTAAGAISGTGNISIGTGGGLTFNQADATGSSNIYSGIISGDGSFTKEGAGIAVLTGANTYTGTTTISAGTLQFGNGGATATALMGTGAVVNNGTLVLNAATNQSFAPNTISGTGAVTVSGTTAGSGTVTLRADNTYSGGITVNGGPRVVAGGGSTGIAGSLTSGPFGTGTVSLGRNSQIELAGYNFANTLKSNWSDSSPTIYLSTGTSELSGQIDLTIASSGLTLSPALGSTLRLTGTLNTSTTDNVASTATKLQQTGAGNVFEGFSSINAGYQISLASTAGTWTLASDPGNSIGLGTKANLALTGGTFDLAGNDLAHGLSNDRRVVSLNGGVLKNSANTTASVWAVDFYISANSTVSTPNIGGDIDLSKVTFTYGNTSIKTLTKTGLGDVHLKGTYTSPPSPLDYNINLLAGNLWFDASAGAGSFAGAYSLAAGTKLYLNTASTFPGAITGDGAVVIRADTTLSGLNTYTGGTTVLNNATLTQGRAVVVSGNTITSSAEGTGDITLGDASTSGGINLGGYSTLPQNIFVNGAASIFSGAASADQVISGVISDGSNAGKSLNFATSASGKAMEITGNNSYTGPTTINGSYGFVLISNANALGASSAGTTLGTSSTLKLKSDITLNEPITVGALFSTFGNLSGNNTLTATYTQTTFGSTITSDAGTLTFAPTTGNAINNGSATLTFSGVGNIAVNGPIVGSTGTVTKNGTGTLTFGGANTYTGDTTISAGSLVIASAGSLASGTYAGVITNNGTFKYSSSATQTLSRGITGTGSLIDDGAGTLTLTGANAYTGSTTISNASSTLVIGGAGSLNNGAYAGAIANSGTFQYASSTAQTLSGLLSGTGILVKGNTGTVTLSGANTYSGGTSLNGGALLLNSTGAIGSTGTISFGGGTLQFSASNTTDYSPRFSTADNQQYSLNTNSQNVTLAGNLTSLGGSLAKLGGGTLSLNGANSYSGTSTISAGTLKAGSATAFGTSTISLVSGAVLDLNGQTIASTGGLTLNGTGISSGGALINSSATASSYAGLVALGSATSIVGDTGTIALSNTGTITGATYGLTLGGAMGGSIDSIIGTTTGTMTKQGAGTWALNGANTYSGSNTISAGTLKAGSATAFGTGTIYLFSGSALDLNGQTMTSTSGLTLNGTGISSGGALMNSGATGATYAGLVTLGSSSSVVGGTSTIALTNTGTITGSSYDLTLGGTAGGSISSVIGTSSGGVIKPGTGIWTLTGINTYSGGTTISSGTLIIGGAGSLSSGAYAGLITNNGIIQYASTATQTLSGGITGTGLLVKDGASALTLTGSNSYSGGTNINGGSLLLNSSAALGSAGTISFGGGTLQFSSINANDYSSRFSSASGQQYLLNTNGQSVTLASALTSTNAILTKLGTGTLTLSGANTYSGGTNLNGGTLLLNSAGALGSSGTISFGGGTLKFSASNTTDYSPRFSTAASQAYLLDTNSQNVTLAGDLTSVGGSLTKLGAGTLTLSGVDTYSGNTTISAGALKAGSATAFGTGAISVTSGAALDLNGQTLTSTGGLTLNGTGISSGGALMNSSASASIYAGLVTLGSTSSILGGTGTIALSNTGTITGATYGLILGGSAGGSIASNIGTTTGTLFKQDAGTWTLNGADTYSGTTTINAGTLKAGSTTAFGTGVISVTSGAALDLNGQSMTSTGTLTLNGTGISNGGALMNSNASGATYAGLVTLGSASSIVGDTGTVALSNAGTISGSYALTLGGSAGGSITSIIGTSAGTLTKQGAGTWAMNGINTYSGTNTISAGTLKAGSARAFGTGAISVTSGAALDLNGQALTSTGALTLNGTGISTGGALINSNATAASYAGLVTLGSASSIVGGVGTIALSNAGTISGATYGLTLDGAAGGSIASIIGNTSGTLTKQGAGTWTLSGANTFTGAVAINAGALRAANSAALGTTAGGVTVASGATLELGGPASPGGIAIGAEALTVADGGAVHNVAGYNTYAGGMTLNGNATITVDTGTTLNFTATGAPAITVAADKRLSLYTNGNLTFGKALVGGNANSSYLQVGSGTLTMGAGSTLTAAIGVYAGLYDPTGSDYSSQYGSTPDYTVAFYNAASGGAKLSLTAGTDFSGTALWTGIVPTASSNVANNYSLTYASGVTISNGRYVLIGSTNASNWTVTPKAITLSLTAPTSTYTYDGSTTYSTIASGLTAFNSTPLVGSDSIGSINNTVSSTGIAQAGNFTITPSGVSLSTGTAANYNFTYTPLTVAVAKAALTVNNTTVANKVYDRTNTATLSGGSLVGVFSGDTVTLTEAGTFASVNVGTGIAVTANDSLGGSSANNYTLTQPTSLSADITPKALTVNNTSVASKTYNGSNTATLSGGSLVGVILGDTVTLTQAGTFASANAGTGITVTASDSLGGSSASNYTVTQPTSLSADINKAHLTVTASNASKTYGDANPALSATVSGFVNNETLGTSGVTGTGAATTAATATTGAGTAVISAGAGTLTATNYDFTNLANGTLTINKADAIVTASSANVTYNGLAQTVSGFTASGLVNGETASVLSGVSASVSGTNAGSYTNSASGTDANYNLTFVTGALNINKAHLTLAANNASKTYGDANPTLSTTLTGFVNGQTLATSGVTGSGTATTTATATTGAGSATITAGIGNLAAANYDFTSLVDGTLTINKAHLTVTASNASKTYGDVNPALSATVSGFVNNETLGTSGVTGTGAATTTATATTGAGTAVISAGAGSLTAANYDFTNLVNGSLTINKAHLTVTANNASKTYGDANPTLSATVSGFVNNETLATSGVTGSGSATTTATATTGAGSATIAAATGNLVASNYDFTSFVDGTLTINKANATVTASSANVTYTGLAQSVSGFTASGLVNGETASVLSGVSASVSGTNAGTYINSASGTDANYNLTFVNGALNINKAHLTVTANNVSKTYGDANPALSATVSGFVNNETLGTSGVTGTGAATTTATATTGAGTAVSSAGTGTLTAANYDFTNLVNGTLTINKANATVTASSGSTTYNGAAQSISGFTATGLVNGETTAVLSGVTAGVTGTNAGTYTSTASGTDSNYNLSFTNGTYTINKAPLTVNLTSQTKVYDGTTTATLANGSLTLTGFMSGEAATVSQTQASYNSAHVLNANTVTASLAAGNYTASNGTLLSNYVLPTTASGMGSITPARLSATGTKTYDGLVAFDATGLTVSGVNGETFAATGSGTMGSKNVQTNQALSSIAGLSLSGNNGALSSNYVALTTSDTQVSVTPLAVNLIAPAASKTYDSTTLYQASAADLTTLSSQLVGTDRVTAAEVVYANKDAGTGKRVSLNSVTINDDNGGNNYTVGKLDVTTGVINKAPLTVSVVSDARFVTQSDTAGYAGVVYNGFVGGETASVVTAGSIARSNSGVNGAGQYTGVLQASGWQSGNYNISYNAGDYTIVGAHTLLVSVPTASTTYGTAATYVPTAQYLDSSNNHIVTLAPTMTGNALSVSDGAGGAASFAITAANATLSSSGNVEAGGYNLQASNVVKTGSNFQNLVMTGGLTVTPKVLSNNLGVQPITKVYDGSASISNLGLNFNQTLAGVTSGDTVSLVGSGSFDDRHVATNKTVNLSLGLLGTDAANYALATPSFSTNTGSITQLASVTYTGATNGNWADFSNWAGGAMPDRNNVAQVVVPTGKTVVYSSDQVGTIGSTLAVDGAILFTSNNAFTLANTVSGAGDLQQRGNGMLTLSGTNTNFTGNLDIGTYQATLNNAQALGTGHVVSNGGQLSVASGMTLNALHVDGAVTVDTAIKTTGDQIYNGALTFLSSGTAQAPNFASDAGNVDFLSTVSAGSGAMTAQRSLAVSALQGRVLFNDQVGRLVKNLDFNTYLTTSLLDTSPYALTVTAPTIKLLGDVTTFDSQTYDGAVLVGNNTLNGNTRLLVSVDPSITFKGTVDDVAPAGKVNGLDVRAISLAALTANMPVPTITFEDNVGSASPLASLRLAAGTQSTASGAVVTDIKTDDTSRRDASYKGDIVLKGNVTVDTAPEMIAEQLLVPNGSPTLTWYTGTPDFRLRLPVSGSSTPPSNLQLVQWGQNNGSGGGSSNSGNTSTSSSTNSTDTSEAGRQWLMAHDTHEHTAQLRANEAAIKTMDTPSGHMVADVQVGNEASTMPTMARGNSSRVEAQTVNVISSSAFLQVREFAPQTLQAQQAFVYQLPADTFVHSRENEYIKLSATLSNGANLPRWVKFSVKDRSFSGEAPKHVKSLDVKVTATDRQGKRATTRIRLVFVNGSNS